MSKCFFWNSECDPPSYQQWQEQLPFTGNKPSWKEKRKTGRGKGIIHTNAVVADRRPGVFAAFPLPYASTPITKKIAGDSEQQLTRLGSANHGRQSVTRITWSEAILISSEPWQTDLLVIGQQFMGESRAWIPALAFVLPFTASSTALIEHTIFLLLHYGCKSSKRWCALLLNYIWYLFANRAFVVFLRIVWHYFSGGIYTSSLRLLFGHPAVLRWRSF